MEIADKQTRNVLGQALVNIHSLGLDHPVDGYVIK